MDEELEAKIRDARLLVNQISLLALEAMRLMTEAAERDEKEIMSQHDQQM